jgi:hypothetical protein
MCLLGSVKLGGEIMKAREKIRYYIWYDNFNWDYNGDGGTLNYEFDDIDDAIAWLEILYDHFSEYNWGICYD